MGDRCGIGGERVSSWKILIVLGLFAPCTAAYAQTDYSAGKTPAQLFSSDCSACHKTPRGLAKTRDVRSLAGFLREHYTSKAESAGALANYLLSSPGAPAEAETRRRHPVQGQSGPPAAAAVTQGAAPAHGTTPTRPRGRKPTAAELAREREEAAKAAEKAAEEAARAKLNSYATGGEAAKPLVGTPAATVPAPADTTPAIPAATAPATPPASADAPNAEMPKSGGDAAASAPKPDAEAKPAESPPAAERPAGTPPG